MVLIVGLIFFFFGGGQGGECDAKSYTLLITIYKK